jgi:uncharacterized membrane protein YagU involved in acid resistance
MKWEPNGKVDVRSPSFPNGALEADRSLSAPSPSPAQLGFSVEISSFSFSCVFKVFSSQPVSMFFSFSLFFSLFYPFFSNGFYFVKLANFCWEKHSGH